MNFVLCSGIFATLLEYSFTYSSSSDSSSGGALLVLFGLLPVVAAVMFYFFFINKYRNQEKVYLFEKETSVEVTNLVNSDNFIKHITEQNGVNLNKARSSLVRSRLDDPVNLLGLNRGSKGLDGLASMEIMRQYMQNEMDRE